MTMTRSKKQRPELLTGAWFKGLFWVLGLVLAASSIAVGVAASFVGASHTDAQVAHHPWATPLTFGLLAALSCAGTFVSALLYFQRRKDSRLEELARLKEQVPGMCTQKDFDAAVAEAVRVALENAQPKPVETKPAAKVAGPKLETVTLTVNGKEHKFLAEPGLMQLVLHMCDQDDAEREELKTRVAELEEHLAPLEALGVLRDWLALGGPEALKASRTKYPRMRVVGGKDARRRAAG